MIANLEALVFDEQGLIPAVVQDARTGQVLMVAYMNQESLKLTIEQGETWFYSRSRQALWHKGATSGNTQQVRSISYDCDGDTLLIQVNPVGPACHTGEFSCFYRQLGEGTEGVEPVSPSVEIISALYQKIQDRQVNGVEDSYTCYLFKQGLDKILKKVGEEAAEVIIGAKNGSPEEVTNEVADLTYHLLVMLAELGVEPNQIGTELARRFR